VATGLTSLDVEGVGWGEGFVTNVISLGFEATRVVVDMGLEDNSGVSRWSSSCLPDSARTVSSLP
jgi:hypothetical protein